jgi:hypothetical protein
MTNDIIAVCGLIFLQYYSSSYEVFISLLNEMQKKSLEFFSLLLSFMYLFLFYYFIEVSDWNRLGGKLLAESK